MTADCQNCAHSERSYGLAPVGRIDLHGPPTQIGRRGAWSGSTASGSRPFLPFRVKSFFLNKHSPKVGFVCPIHLEIPIVICKCFFFTFSLKSSPFELEVWAYSNTKTTRRTWCIFCINLSVAYVYIMVDVCTEAKAKRRR